MIMKLKFLIHRNHFIYVYVTKTFLYSFKSFFLEGLQNSCILCAGWNCIIISIKWYCQCSSWNQIQLQHLILLTVMQIHRSRVQLMKSLRLVHLSNFLSDKKRAFPFLLHISQMLHTWIYDQLVSRPVHIPETVISGRECRPCPWKTSRQTFQFLCI